MRNTNSLVRMAMINEQGKAQIFNKKLVSFTLQKMKVDKIFFAQSQWIGFLGYHETPGKTDQYSES